MTEHRGNEFFKIIKKIDDDKEKLLKKKIPMFLPDLPSWLENELRAAKHGDESAIRRARRKVIQEIIFGGTTLYAYGYERILNMVDLSPEEAETIKEQVRRAAKTIDPTSVSFTEVVEDFKLFLKHLDLGRKITKDEVVVFDLGCGKAPEVTAIKDSFGSRLKEFVGFDRNQNFLALASENNAVDGRIRFVNYDFQTGLPSGNPDLVIVRNPNVFEWEESGQNKVNPTWEKVFKTLKGVYPNPALLVTTSTEEEVEMVKKWLGREEGPLSRNPFSTPVTAEVGNYGRFSLPVSIDKYYLLAGNFS